MRPFWHPLSALVVPDPPMFATTRILKMLLIAGGGAEVVYAGDRMTPQVRHGARVRLDPAGGEALRAGEVVVSASGSVSELMRVERASAAEIVLRPDSDPELVVRARPEEILARTRLPRVKVSGARRRAARLRLDLAEAWSGRPDAAAEPGETVRDKYQSQAAYYAWGQGPPIEAALLERVRAEVRAGGAVLVAGSGAGGETIALAEAGFAARGVDFAAGMVEAAQDRAAMAGLSVPFAHADLRVHDEPAGALDAVLFTYDVYSFLPGRAERIALLRRMAAWLAPGGRVYLSARRVRSRWERVILSIQRLRRTAAVWGDSHTRWIAADGKMRRSYVRLFDDRELAAEIEEAGLRPGPWIGGHMTCIPVGARVGASA